LESLVFCNSFENPLRAKGRRLIFLNDTKPRPPLPEGYRSALDEAFGSCGEGETDRSQPTKEN
jgi:hypothetical protein